mgnify:CR=1 FL=1|jgi:radical SAM superfamily enzyme YgiQ (UPF0313 family)
MQSKLLLTIPPFTQLNTPYPATAYVKGYLDEKGYACEQIDLSITLFTSVFSAPFLTKVFDEVGYVEEILYPDIFDAKHQYIDTVDAVIEYLQHQNTVGAYQILRTGFLPKFHRFQEANDLEYSFGDMGIIDKAKYYATLYIEELGDFIQANIDEDFAFTKYAEKIARTASSFSPIEAKLQEPLSIVEVEYIALLKKELDKHQPTVIGFTIPFPGNLFSSLRGAQYIKEKYPKIKVLFGGGYCNTELRKLSDPTIFKYVDFISLDDGEAPLTNLLDFLEGKCKIDMLERTFILEDNKVVYKNKLPNTHIKHEKLPAPTYLGLPLKQYVSFLDVLNPMHRMWSDGRWNKLTISHGCYWAKCSFCDVNLDYIGRYENTTAKDLVNKAETLVKETGDNGFHFVDEAAPPKMLKAFSQEVIKRKLKIVWWTNIRFEKTFDLELCSLMAQAGCIAVTGGLEVASDRLLKLMKKGVSIEQVAKVTKAFSENDILVHAYLMYGFPTETAQETVDSVEIVRQLFQEGCIQSGFWHRFTTTSHSPVGKSPDDYDITITGPEFEGFAENDLFHQDLKGANHDDFSKGLKTSLFNFMNGAGLDWDVRDWFEVKTPTTKLHPDLIYNYLN